MWCPAKIFSLHIIPLLIGLIIAIITDSSFLELRMLPFRPSTQSALQFRSSSPHLYWTQNAYIEVWICDTKMHYKHTTSTSYTNNNLGAP